MSLKQKTWIVVVLLALAVALGVGTALSSTHVTLGTFLLGAALMLGPFAGAGLFLFAALIAVSLPQKSIASVGGALVLAAVGLVIFTPLGIILDAIVPLYAGGAALGAVAVVLVPTGLPGRLFRF